MVPFSGTQAKSQVICLRSLVHVDTSVNAIGCSSLWSHLMTLKLPIRFFFSSWESYPIIGKTEGSDYCLI